MSLLSSRPLWLSLVIALALVADYEARAAVVESPSSSFSNAVITRFTGPVISPSYSNDFGNGLLYRSLSNAQNAINYSGQYGLAENGEVNGGRGGIDDGYFGTSGGPDAIEFSLIMPIRKFGFFGAEARNAPAGPAWNDGRFMIDFYAVSNQLVASVEVTSTTNYAWSQFHGFSSDIDVNRIVLRDVGALILDDVQFLPTSTAAQLSLATYAGITIVGTLGHSYRIEYLNAVGGTNWTVLTNIALPSVPYLFFDTSSPSAGSRFYRSVANE